MVRVTADEPTSRVLGFTDYWFIDLPSGSNWLWLCSEKRGPVPGWLPAFIRLADTDPGVWVIGRGEFDVRVYFPLDHPRQDLRYHEIGDYLSVIEDQATFAQDILNRMRGMPIVSRAHAPFIDGLTVLLFGVEASRNWASCATTLMLLELIAQRRTYGRTRKLFTLTKAFHHATKRWDGTTFYGGKHSMATHGTGAGNLIDRGRLIRGDFPDPLNEVASRPQHHMVVYREIRILTHWLHFRDPRVRSGDNSAYVVALIRALLDHYYF
jgi:hypothetical protein